MKKNIWWLFFSLIVTSVFAEAPVVDYSSSSLVTPSRGYDKGRIDRLEQQIVNINEQKLSDRVEELQQKVQELSGKVEFQEHQIEQLNEQLKNYYQDLDQRLNETVTTSKPVAATGSLGVLTESDVKKAKEVKDNKASDALKEQQMYQTAIDLLPEKKKESIKRLRKYLDKYPGGLYVSDAHYWLGEIKFLQKKFGEAEKEFKIIVNKYPKARRAADALFKLALTHKNQGKKKEAEKELDQVIKSYPREPAAQLAKQWRDN